MFAVILVGRSGLVLKVTTSRFRNPKSINEKFPAEFIAVPNVALVGGLVAGVWPEQLNEA